MGSNEVEGLQGLPGDSHGLTDPAIVFTPGASSTVRQLSRLTVVGPSRRIDLSVPSGVAVDEFLGDLVRLAGENEDSEPRAWLLSRLGGTTLDPELSLAESGVLDGEMLYLRPVTNPIDPPIVEDFVDTIATVVEAWPRRWRNRHLRWLLVVLAWGMGLLALLPFPERTGAESVLAALVALIAGAGLLVFGKRLQDGGAEWAGTLAGLGGLPLWALAGINLVALEATASPATTVAAATGAVLVGSILVLRTIRGAAEAPCAALVLMSGTLAVASAGLILLGGSPVQAAVILSLWWLATIGALPRLVTWATDLVFFDRSRRPDSPAAVAEVRERVGRSRRLFVWMLGGVGAGLGSTLVILASTPGIYERGFCAMVVLAVALKARDHLFAAEVLPLALASATGAVALEASLLLGIPSPVRLLVVLGTGAILIGSGILLGERVPSARVRQYLRHLETAVNVALIPLALGAMGIFETVANLSRGVG